MEYLVPPSQLKIECQDPNVPAEKIENLDSLTGLVADIFNDIKPALYSLAIRYKTPNRRDFVASWFSRAYEIVWKFEQGQLTKKVYVCEDNQNEMITYDPQIHSRDHFLRSLKNYLKQCFTNDLIKNFNVTKKENSRNIEFERNIGTTHHSGFSVVALMKYDAITIDSICRLMEIDHERVQSNCCSVIDTIQCYFLKAMLNHCRVIMARGEPWSKMVAVPDVEEKEKKKFFSLDFKDEFENGLRLELSKMIFKEQNPIIIQRLGMLISRENRGTLQKRIFRYFFRYRGGYPDRLKSRIQNKTL